MKKGNYGLLMSQVTNIDLIKITAIIILRELRDKQYIWYNIYRVWGAGEVKWEKSLSYHNG